MENIHKKWKTIRKEALEQLKNLKTNHNLTTNINPYTEGWVRGLTNPNLLNYCINYNGKFLNENCIKCPNTYQLVKELAYENNIIMACFSLMIPKSSISPHINQYTHIGSKVFNLGLSIQNPKKCILLVDGKVQNQENGKLILFDDTKQNSFLNATNDNSLIFYVKLKI